MKNACTVGHAPCTTANFIRVPLGQLLGPFSWGPRRIILEKIGAQPAHRSQAQLDLQLEAEPLSQA